jgi:GT2 family glycosyltransferase
MDVSIIIVNYNTTQLLIDTIDSVFAKTKGIKYEIIVIDNNSSDNPRNILVEKYGDKITYLGLSENIGFGRANNEAAKITKGRNLLFLNPDTILLNNAAKILSDYLDDNPRVGCCGGNLIDRDERPIHSFGCFFTPSIFEEINQLFLRLPEKLLYGKNTFFNYTNEPLRVNYITGADLMIRKELFDRLHGFDSDFFMYYEESELEYRIKKAGYKIISVPYARIIHLEGKSFSDNIERLKKIYASRIISLKKTHNRISIKIINALFILKTKQRLVMFTLLRNKEKLDFWLTIQKIFIDQRYN